MTSFTRLTKSVLSWFILVIAALSSLKNGGGGSKIHSFLNTKAALSAVAPFFFAAFFLVAIFGLLNLKRSEISEADKRITPSIYSLHSSPGKKEWRLIYTDLQSCQQRSLQAHCSIFIPSIAVRHSFSLGGRF